MSGSTPLLVVRDGVPHGARPMLDAVRWVSALIVAVGHAIGLVLASAPLSPDHPVHLMLAVIGNLRGPAVVLFFVLSGYLVGGGVMLRRDAFRWRGYVLARFSRIYVVLIPAILLIVALDRLGMAVTTNSPIYTTIWGPGALGQRAVADSYTIGNLIASCLALASVVIGQPIGTGGPLWSLAHEWVFYFLFPALVVPLRGVPGLLAPLAAVGAMVLLLVALHRTPTAAFFVMWTLGVVARVAVDRGGVPRVAARIAMAVAIAAFLLLGFSPYRAVELLLAASFSVFLSSFPAGERGLSTRWDAPLADRSFSLYVIHLPVMAMIAMLANRWGELPEPGLLPTSAAQAVRVVVLVMAMVVAALAVAWPFAAAFELRTPAFRRWLDARLPGGQR